MIAEKPHKGFLIYDDSQTQKRPGILVIHEWKGISDHVRQSGRKLAELGYVAFVADIYGVGIRPETNAEAGKLAGSYKSDRAKFRKKVLAGLKQLTDFAGVDSDKIAAIGYCFGGTAVLELARSGAKIAGVVSFHGGLDSPKPEDGKNIKAKVLVLHGAVDPHAPEAEISAFQKEMIDSGVDWQMIYYGNAVHGFTSKASGNDPSKGVAYNEAAARRSWQAMLFFFKELFNK
jgi:dienelactone hydrolase